MKINIEELGMGTVFGVAMFPAIGAPAFLLGLMCSALWAVGGSGAGRAWRFVGCPIAAFVFLLLSGSPALWAAVACGISCAVLTMGYGIPDGSDEGSFLGKLMTRIAGKKNANLATRAVYALMLSCGFWAFPATIFIMTAGQILAAKFLDGEIVI